MNEEFAEAVARINELRMGNEAAQQAITEALMATLLTAFPPLTEQMRAHLEALSELQRQRLASEEPMAMKMFESRIDQAHGLLNALQGGS